MPGNEQPSAVPATPRRAWVLYVAGFMGPFGGAMVNTMLPELAVGLNTDLTTVTWAISAYTLPFSLGMLFSGTLAMRWGQARTVRTAFLVYAVASLLCVLVTHPLIFFAARGVQGLANAFTSPVLIALISRIVPRERLGRAIGMYTSMAAAGQAFAPLVGGVAAGWDYRAAFVATTVVAAALTLLVPRIPDTGERSPGPWGALANLRLVQACVVAFGFQVAASTMMVLGALLATDHFGLSPGLRGLVVAVFGVSGFLAGPFIGGLSDRFGIARTGVVAIVILAIATTLSAWAPWLWLLVALIAIAGVFGTGARILSNTMAVRSTPANPGGATSITMSAQFLGTAAAPLVLIPVYLGNPLLATGIGGLLAIVAAVAVMFNRPPAD